MSVGNEVQALMNFGLTATQARAYLSLNALGISDAKSVSKLSKIPRQDIYRILDELFEMGLVEKVIAKPAEFKAISPIECFALLVQQRKKETEKLEKDAARIFETVHYTVTERKEEPQTVLLSPKAQILLKAEELISSLKESLCVFSPPYKLFPWLFADQDFLEEAIRRNVRLRFVTMKTEIEALPKFLLHSGKDSLVEIRFMPKRPALSFGVCDKQKLILELSVESGYLESEVFVSNNSCFVELALVCFESVWAQADKVRFRK